MILHDAVRGKDGDLQEYIRCLFAYEINQLQKDSGFNQPQRVISCDGLTGETINLRHGPVLMTPRQHLLAREYTLAVQLE